MKIKIKCYAKLVYNPRGSWYTRYTFIPVLNRDKNVKEDVLFSVKFTKDVPSDIIPNVSSTLICEGKNVSISFDKEEVWITGIEDVIPMERPVTDLSQYFEVVDEPEKE